jgi:ferritin-like metal-binding protein YciE
VKLETLEDLFLTELRDLYDAEVRLIRALPKIAKACFSERLRLAFQDHWAQTEGQLLRLEEAFRDAEAKPRAGVCYGMKGLIEEAERIIDEADQSALRDAGLIAAGSRVERYEIAAYGTAIEHARLLGYTKSARLLEETLGEEKLADVRLGRIARDAVNEEALESGAVTVTDGSA